MKSARVMPLLYPGTKRGAGNLFLLLHHPELVVNLRVEGSLLRQVLVSVAADLDQRAQAVLLQVLLEAGRLEHLHHRVLPEQRLFLAEPACGYHAPQIVRSTWR